MVINRRILKILVLALACLATAALLLFGLVPKKEKITVRYAVLFTVENEMAAAFSVGDKLTDGASKGDIGTVTEVALSPAMEETERGAFSLPDKSRVILTVMGEGVSRKGVPTVGGVSLLPGRRLSLHGRGAAYGVCLWTETVEEATAK